MNISERPTKQFLEEAVEYITLLIQQAGEMSLKMWNKVEITEQKDRRDVATKADVEIQQFLKEKITTQYPDHGFRGEESQEHINPSASYQWLIDPIDGTKFYVALAPFFQVYIALTFEGAPVLGLIYNPTSRQLFSAFEKGGAYLNGKKISLKPPLPLNEAIINVDFGGAANKTKEQLEWMMNKLARFVKDSYRVRMMAGVANIYLVTGAIDAYVDFFDSKPEEFAARLIIMREAGFEIEWIDTLFGKKMLIVSRDPIFSALKRIVLEK